jgi:hypothetical protein
MQREFRINMTEILKWKANGTTVPGQEIVDIPCISDTGGRLVGATGFEPATP